LGKKLRRLTQYVDLPDNESTWKQSDDSKWRYLGRSSRICGLASLSSSVSDKLYVVKVRMPVPLRRVRKQHQVAGEYVHVVYDSGVWRGKILRRVQVRGHDKILCACEIVFAWFGTSITRSPRKFC
jgi:hypothetical protein